MNSTDFVSVRSRVRVDHSCGYVHKCRLEARDGALVVVSETATSAGSVGRLLVKFVAAALVLGAMLAAGAGALGV